MARLLSYLVVAIAVRHVRNSDNDSEYRIVGQGGVIKVELGSTMQLDCPVTQLSDGPANVMLWKKGHRVLTAGNIKVRRDPRMELIGTDLTISGVGVHDGGLYRCEVEQDTDQPLAVVHTVEILVPPTVQPEPPNGEIVVRSGASVNLECKVNGNPRPTVEWTRYHGGEISLSVDTGTVLKHSLTQHGSVLTLHSVTRAASGVYICTATNGVGQPATSQINLHVLYLPHIHPVQQRVEGGVGEQQVMSCIVHAEPAPEMVWFKNSMKLDMKRGYILTSDNKKYSLTIPNVGEEDFANYTCQAINSLGKKEEMIQLRGNPVPPQINSQIQYVSRNCYRISWETTSYQQVLQYRVQWKKAGTYSSALLTPNWSSHIFSDPVQKEGSEPVPGSWEIKGLQENEGYEARVMARNRYGWSDWSENFYFFTQPNVMKARPTQRNYFDSNQFSTLASSASVGLGQFALQSCIINLIFLWLSSF